MRLQMSSLLKKILRITLYKCISAIRICRNINSQMFSKQNLQNAYNSLNRSRKFALIGIIALVILLYMWPSWLSFGSSKDIKIDLVALCIEAKIAAFRLQQGPQNVVTNHDVLQEENEKAYIPFVGNGYIGSSYELKSKLHIKDGRALARAVNFYPTVTLKLVGFPYKEVFVTTLLEGIVSKVQCFKVQEQFTLTATTQVYAHRTRPGILVQEFHIQNPSNKAVTLDLSQIGVSGWQGVSTASKRADAIKNSIIDYTVNSGVIPGTLEDTVVGIASVKLPETITVQPTSTWTHHILTSVKYKTVPKSGVKKVEVEKTNVTVAAETHLNNVLIINVKLLREEHLEGWKQLWHSGFAISQSLAPGAVNGENINMTFYYVMSHSLTPIHNPVRTENEKTELRKLLHFPDRCYEGHHTLQNEKLWTAPSTVQFLIALVKVWILTLEKQGCSTMLKAGADGVLQAMLLSLGPLQFKNDHLEFRTHPKDLHRDYYFRRINYGNNTHVNITVIVGEDNKAVLQVALDRNDKHFYACDAGCLDAPVKLSRQLEKFPVKLTEPLTAILYITYDKPHIEELKHAIHVKEIGVAPPHEHHVMALHRHGHHLGGLPMLFWGSIAFLIITFHLFLFKLVYNEYCSGNNDTVRYTRTRYSL